MQKDDSKDQARIDADSEQNDQDLSVIQHNANPHVVGSQCHGTYEQWLSYNDNKYPYTEGFAFTSYGGFNYGDKRYLSHVAAAALKGRG